MIRQQANRAAHRAAKFAEKARRADSAAATLATLRAGRRVSGNRITYSTSVIRPYKKAHGQANRSVTDLVAFPDTGQVVPDHLELSFHATKGLRCVRVPT